MLCIIERLLNVIEVVCKSKNIDLCIVRAEIGYAYLEYPIDPEYSYGKTFVG